MVTVAGSYPKTTVPTAAELRMLNRMSTGFTRAQLSAMRAAGGPAGWLDKQLAPSTVTEAPIVTTINDWYPDRLVAPDVKWQRKEAGTKSVWAYARDLSCWTQLRRVYSTRTVLETMTDFWSGHFHIPAHNVFAWPWRSDYDTMIRANALGRFEDLLIAATLHPAMLLYLDNYLSEFGNPNENQGRELLELHTVGREAGYTEAMVRSSALILSGWTVDFPRHVRRVVPATEAHHRRGQRPRLPGCEHRPGRSRADPALPALPGAPPGHGATHRAQAGAAVRDGEPEPGSRGSDRREVPGGRHGYQGHAALHRGPPEFMGSPT